MGIELKIVMGQLIAMIPIVLTIQLVLEELADCSLILVKPDVITILQ